MYLVVLFLTFIASSQAIYFFVIEGQTRCFIEEVPSETLVLGTYRNPDFVEWGKPDFTGTVSSLTFLWEFLEGHVHVCRSPSSFFFFCLEALPKYGGFFVRVRAHIHQELFLVRRTYQKSLIPTSLIVIACSLFSSQRRV